MWVLLHFVLLKKKKPSMSLKINLKKSLISEQLNRLHRRFFLHNRKASEGPFFVIISGCAAALWLTLPKAHTRGDQAPFLITHTNTHTDNTHTQTHADNTRTSTQFLAEASRANGWAENIQICGETRWTCLMSPSLVLIRHQKAACLRMFVCVCVYLHTTKWGKRGI